RNPKRKGMRCHHLANQRSGRIQSHNKSGRVIPSATKKSWRKPIRKTAIELPTNHFASRPNLKNNATLKTVQATSSEKKKKTAKPARERFHGKSSGESSFTVHGFSPTDNRDGSVGTTR